MSYSARNSDQAIRDLTQLKEDWKKIRVTGSNVLRFLKIEEILKLCEQDYILGDVFTIKRDKERLERLKESGLKRVFITSSYSDNVTKKVSLEEASKAIKKLGLELAISYIMTHNNKGEVANMVEEAISVNANSMRFMRYLPTDEKPNSLNLTDDEERELIDKIYKLRSEIPKDKIKIFIHGHFGTKFRPSKGPICFAGEEMFFIGLDNLVYPCEFLINPNNVMGKFFEGKVKIDRKLCGYENDECKLLQMHSGRKR